MKLFKKTYTQQELQIIELDIKIARISSDEVSAYHNYNRVKMVEDKIRILQQATGQDHIILNDVLYHFDSRGDLVVKDLYR